MRVSALNMVVLPDFFSPISPIFTGASIQDAVYSIKDKKQQQPYPFSTKNSIAKAVAVVYCTERCKEMLDTRFKQ
jgi:hypothetical protein